MPGAAASDGGPARAGGNAHVRPGNPPDAGTSLTTILTRNILLKVSLYESVAMKTILAVAVLLVAAVVFVPDWITPEELGPRPDIKLPTCVDCF